MRPPGKGETMTGFAKLGIPLALLLAVGCLDRKQIRDAAAPVDGAASAEAATPAQVDVGAETGRRDDGGADGPTDVPQVLDAAPTDGTTDRALATDGPIEPAPDLATENSSDSPLTADAAPDLGTELPPSPEAGPESPAAGCAIGGITYPKAAANPTNPCQVCDPVASPSAWTSAREGTACATGQYCNLGACKTGCFIAGAFYESGAPNPADACQTCAPTYSAAAWTTSAHGATCGAGQVCSSGVCQSGCFIEGTLVASGATHPSNPCQTCKPAASTSGWSNGPDGTSCGTGKICGAGVCQAGCYVGGTVHGVGAVNPANACQTCSPSHSTTAWYQVPSHCATIAAHFAFACATVDGAAKCWGSNGHAESPYDYLLGIGRSRDETPYSAEPLDVSNLGAQVQAISAGAYSSHSCALVNGGVRCWGFNGDGRLGDGTTTARSTPVQVVGLTTGVLGIATGESHSCALLKGEVQCWGSNGLGQLGPSDAELSPIPVTAMSGSIQSIAVGDNHSCGLTGGAVWCWGSNSSGQLGNGSTTNSQQPVAASGLGSNVLAIAAGSGHTCAIANGSVHCWGANWSGQLGDGTTTDRSASVPVPELPNGVLAVAAGRGHTCAVVNGGAWCWGSNSYGQLGDGSTTDRSSPVPVKGLSGTVKAITAGVYFSCALTSAEAKCWGLNLHGQLGNASAEYNPYSPTPVPVEGL